MATYNPSPDSNLPEDSTYLDLRDLDGQTVDLPEVDWLTSADFHQVGPDLVIESPSGEKIFLIGYYDNAHNADLVGVGGVKIPGRIVNAMDGSPAPNQYAQSVELNAAEPIGRVETAQGDVYAVRADGTRVQLKQGEPIFQGDTLETAENGVVGITFSDDSTLSLDENARMVIDEMVYDPGSEEGSASMFVLQGAMSFVSGQLAKVNPDAMQIDTPVATIGIRGTSVLVSAQSEKMSVIMMPERGPNGDIFVGEAVVQNGQGSQILGSGSSGSGFQGVSVNGGGSAPSSPQPVSIAEVSNVFGGVISSNPNRNSVPENVFKTVEKIAEHKQAEEQKAEIEAKIEDAKANGEDTSALEQQLQEADKQAAELKQEAEAAINDLAEELGNPDLAKESNLTGENKPIGNGDNPDDPQKGNNGNNNNNGNGDEPVDTPPPPPGPVPPVPPGPVLPKPVPPIPTEPNTPPPPVNHAPNISGDVALSSVEDDATLTITREQLLANASDPDGDTLKIINLNADYGSIVKNANGTWTYTPESGYSGPVSFSYEVSDGKLTTSASANLTATIGNEAPVNSAAVTLTGVEDTPQIIYEADLLANASDADGDTLTVQNLTSDQGTLVDNGDGSWSFTPDPDSTATVNLTYDISDGTTATPANATISITNVNDAPTATTLAVSGTEDSASTFLLSTLQGNTGDVDGDPLTLMVEGTAAVSGTPWGGPIATAHGLLDFDGTEFSFFPDPDWNGTENIAYTVSDGTLTTNSTIDVTVTPVDDAPIITPTANNAVTFDGVDDYIDMPEMAVNDMAQGTIEMWVKVSDLGGTVGTGTTLIRTQGDSVNTLGYLGIGVNDGSTVTASAGQLYFQSQNGSGVYSTNTIGADEWHHVAVTFDNGAASIYIDGVLDSTHSGDYSIPLMSEASVTGAGHDFSSTIGGTPDGVQSGANSIDTVAVWDTARTQAEIADTYQNGIVSTDTDLRWHQDYNDGSAIDLTGNGNDGIMMNGATQEDLPTIPVFEVAEDGSLSDTFSATDIDGDTLTYGSVLAPANGSITINSATGQYLYTPAANWSGTDSFTLQVSDGTTTIQQTFSVRVSPVNDAPIMTTPAITINVDEGDTYSATLSATDIEGDLLDFGLDSAPANGIASVDLSGNFTYKANPGFTGTDTFIVKVSDGTNVTTETITVTVNSLPDQLVNTTTTDEQKDSNITGLINGGFVATWTSANQDGSGWGVYAQLYNPDGTKNGTEFLVNTTTASSQWEPTTVSLSDGNFIIAWSDEAGSASGASAQRFNENGTANGTEFKLNTTAINYSAQPQMAALADGGFAVTYRLEGSGVANTDYSDIFIRTFDNTNTEVMPETVVNTGVYMDHQKWSDVTANDSGEILVVWANTNGVDSPGIYGRLYNGSTWGADFAISTTSDALYPKVVTLDSGYYIATWQSSGDGSDNGIFAQMITPSGATHGPVINVNTTTAQNQSNPEIEVLANGDYVIVWQGQGDDSLGVTTEFGIYAQIFTANGEKKGPEILVNDVVAGDQTTPSVMAHQDGGFSVSFTGPDADTTGVYIQHFDADGHSISSVPTNVAPTLSNMISSSETALFGDYYDAKFGDIDGDGDLDLILAKNSVGDVVYHINDGNGNFSAESIGIAGQGYGHIEVADFNGDGYADIATGAGASSTTGDVYLGDGSGGFTTTNIAYGAIAKSHAVDIDNDGDLDLVTSIGTTALSGRHIWKNDGSGNFTDTGQTLGVNSKDIKHGDFDGDGDMDLIVGDTQTAEIYANDGTGVFTAAGTINLSAINDSNGGVQGAANYYIEVGDFNGDGTDDIWFTNRYISNEVFFNDGDGNMTFTEGGTYGPSAYGSTSGSNDREGSSMGDIDGDGDLDIITSRWDGEDEIWINDGTGHFTNANADGTLTVENSRGNTAAIGDLNGDTIDDIFLANSDATRTSELLVSQGNNIDYCYLTDAPINPYAHLTISDADSVYLSSAQVTVGSFAAGDTLTVGTAGSLTVNYNSSTGVLDITGYGSLDEYQAALRSMTFTSTTDAATTRTLSLTVSDNQGTTSTALSTTVNFVNTDPIVIDLDGDGVELVNAANGVLFDSDADGDKEHIGWAGMDDGILALDINGDGQINDMSEVVSHYFAYQDKNADYGLDSSLDVLNLYDDNADGVIDAHDDIYDHLQVWNDANGDGITDEGELKTLSDQGITSIDLGHQDTDQNVDGNLVSKTGSVTFEDGSQGDWNEVAFELENNNTAQTESSTSTENTEDSVAVSGNDAQALFNHVVGPLLDDDILGTFNLPTDASLNDTTIESASNTFDELSLLKEIVQPDSQVALQSALPDDGALADSPTLVVNNDATVTTTVDPGPVDNGTQESYTSTAPVDDPSTLQVAE